MSVFFSLGYFAYTNEYSHALFFILIFALHQSHKNALFVQQHRPFFCLIKLLSPLAAILFFFPHLYAPISPYLLLCLILSGHVFGGYLVRHLPDGLEGLSMKTTTLDICCVLLSFYSPTISLLYLFSLGVLGLYQARHQSYTRSIALFTRVFFIQGLFFYLLTLCDDSLFLLFLLSIPFYLHCLNESLCIQILPMVFYKRIN